MRVCFCGREGGVLTPDGLVSLALCVALRSVSFFGTCLVADDSAAASWSPIAVPGRAPIVLLDFSSELLQSVVRPSLNVFRGPSQPEYKQNTASRNPIETNSVPGRTGLSLSDSSTARMAAFSRIFSIKVSLFDV